MRSSLFGRGSRVDKRGPRKQKRKYPGRRLVVRCDSEVVEGDSSPVFNVEHCGQLLAKEQSGLMAWHASMQLDGPLARRTVFRLVRCKAVLNRLCCSSDVTAFLEAVKPAEVPGYHSKIFRPVYMRLVDERLKRGGYLNEFAFASDVRLAWSNAKLFNREGSELWTAADRLSSEFEALFCEWVINPPDGFGRGTQGNAPARGPWDEWQHLRYFDPFGECRGCSKASKKNGKSTGGGIDVVTPVPTIGRSGPPELVCSSCEDEWHAACLGAAAAAAATAAALEGRPFMCPRCTAWANAGGVTGGCRGMVAGVQGHSQAGAPWTPQFHPHSTLPAGFQLQDDPPTTAATAVTSAATESSSSSLSSVSARQVFLTPAGSVVVGLAVAEMYAKAHQGRVTADQKAKGGARKRDVLFTVSGQEGEDSAYYIVVAGFDRVYASIAPAGSPGALPPDGLFGLSVPDIKNRVEGLSNADLCELYVFKSAALQREDAERRSQQRRKADDALQTMRANLRSRLAEERWHWVRRRERAGEERHSVSKVDTYAAAREQALEKQRKNVQAGVESAGASEPNELLPPTLGNPEALFASNPPLSGCTVAVEQSLMAWDFLSSFRDLVGFVVPPAKRLIEGLTPPEGKASIIPSPSELAFSEACMILTKMLLLEITQVLRKHMSKKLVDEVLAQRPINLLTWPEVAGDALVALVNHRAHPEMRTSEMAALLSVRPSGWLARCGDMVAILISRPLAAAFVRPVDPQQVPGYADVVSKPMDLSTVRRRLWSRRYQWHQQVVEDLRLVWSNAKAFNQEYTDFWHAADSLALLTESLYEAWVLLPERRRDAESMREAGLSGVDSAAASSSAAQKEEEGVAVETGRTEGGVQVAVKVKQEHPTAATLAPTTPATPDAATRVDKLSPVPTANVKVEPGAKTEPAGANAVAPATAVAAAAAAAMAAAAPGAASTPPGGEEPVGMDVVDDHVDIAPNDVVAAASGGARSPKRDGPRRDEADDDEAVPAGDPGAAAAAAAAGSPGRPGRLPLDPGRVHPAFAGRRPLPRHESPASGRAYGLWDPDEVHPVYFGHLRHDGETSGAAGIAGWTGAGDGGALDRGLRVLRGAVDTGAAPGAIGHTGGIAEWSAEARATVLGLLCEEASMTETALEHMTVLIAQESAAARARKVESGMGGEDADGVELDDEPFEAPGDDEAAVPELPLSSAGEPDVAAAEGVCCLCGGAEMSAGSDLLGAKGEPWVLVPPELKALPAKLLPRFMDLQRDPGNEVVRTTPGEGAEVRSSLLAPTWLRRLYGAQQNASAMAENIESEDDSDDSDDSREGRRGGGGDGGEDKAAAEAAADAVKAALTGPSAATDPVASAQAQSASPSAENPPKMDENPFAARIAAHAGCAKKLWRSRYLALREERRLRRQEERSYAYPTFVDPPAPQRYDPYGRHQWAAAGAHQHQPSAYQQQMQMQLQQQQEQQQRQQQLQQVQAQAQAQAQVHAHAQAQAAAAAAAATVAGQYPGQIIAGAPALAGQVTTLPSPAAVIPATPTPANTAGVGAAAATATHLPPTSVAAAAATGVADGAVMEVVDVSGDAPLVVADATAGARAAHQNGTTPATPVAAVPAPAALAPATPGPATPIPASPVAISSMAIAAVSAGGVDADVDEESDLDEEALAKKLQSGHERRDYCRNRALGRDRYGNEYWRLFGDKHMVFVVRHGSWWGKYDGPSKIQELVRSLDVTKDGERHLRNRLHENIDVWGVSDKLEAFLKAKQAQRDRADPSASAWGVFGGGTGSGKKRKASGSSFIDERRREEGDRLRGQLERVAKTAQWKRHHGSRESWLEMEMRSFEDSLPVEAAGSGDALVDFRFVAASIRQQRLFARSLELRLGEYLQNYDDEREVAVDEAYRNGDVDQLRLEKSRVKNDLGDDLADNKDGLGWVRRGMPAVTRDIASETRALRLLHTPDLRTPAQKRKDVEAFASGSISAASAAAAAMEAAAVPLRIYAREQARAAAALAGPAAWQNVQTSAGTGHADGATADGDALGKSDGSMEAGTVGGVVKASASASTMPASSATAPGTALSLEVGDSASEGLGVAGGVESPRSLSPRPGSASLPGYEEDDMNSERSYWEPSIASVGLVSPEMVKLKVEMLAMALCLPQRWERASSATPRGRTRGRVRQRTTDDAPASSTATTEAAEATPEVRNNGARSTTLPPGQFFAPSRGIAPELTAALKEAVEQQAAYAAEEAEDDIDIGVENTALAPPPADSPDGNGGHPGDDSTASAAASTMGDTSGGVLEGSGLASAVEAVTPAEPEAAPKPEPVADQPFVRKAQGKWLSAVESSSDEEDYEDYALTLGKAPVVGQSEEDAAIHKSGTASSANESAAAVTMESVKTEPASVAPSAPPSVTDASAVLEDPQTVVSAVTAGEQENGAEEAPGASRAPAAPAAAVAAAVPSSAVAGPQDSTVLQLATVTTNTETTSALATKLKTDPGQMPPPLAAVAAVPTGVAEAGNVEMKVEPATHTEQSAPADALSPPVTRATTATPAVEELSMLLDLEGWQERVRRAETPEDLATLALELDYALPREEGWVEPWYKTESFPEPHLGGGSSLAAAATRVFALDRALRWNIIPRPRRGGSRLPGDTPRAWVFFHQCPLAPVCIRPCFHKGKCKYHRSGISRVDHPMVVPAPPYTPPYAATHYATTQAATYAAGTHTAAQQAFSASPAPCSASGPLPAATQAYMHHTVAAPAPAPAQAHTSSTAVGGGGVFQSSAALAYAAQVPAASPAPATAAAPAAGPVPVMPPPAYQHPTPTPARPVEGIAAAVARAASGVSNAGAAPAIAPAVMGVAPTAPAPGMVMPGLPFAGVVGGVPPPGISGWFPATNQLTPEQAIEFHAKAETAIREAFVATLGGPQAAAWAAAAAAAAGTRHAAPAAPGQASVALPAPGRVAAAPGQVASAPGQVVAAPGQVTAAPGQVAVAPGQVAAAPGQVAAAPGQVAAAPGQVAAALPAPRQVAAAVPASATLPTTPVQVGAPLSEPAAFSIAPVHVTTPLPAPPPATLPAQAMAPASAEARTSLPAIPIPIPVAPLASSAQNVPAQAAQPSANTLHGGYPGSEPPTGND